MDALVQGRKNGTLDETFGREPGGRNLPPAQVAAARRRRRHPGPLRRRHRRQDLHAAVRRLAGRQGHLARRHRRLRERDRAVPQPVAVPARVGRERARLQGADPAHVPRATRHREAGGPARPRGGVGLLRREQRGRDLVVWKDDTRTQEWLRFHYPRQRKAPFLSHRRLLPPGRLGRDRLRRVPRRDDGHRGQCPREGTVRGRQVPGLPVAARPLGRDDRSARRVVAPAHPRGVGLRRRGRSRRSPGCSSSSTAGRATRGVTRRVPTSTTRRRSPSCSRSNASACHSPRSSTSSPSSRPARSSSPTPRRSTSWSKPPG